MPDLESAVKKQLLKRLKKIPNLYFFTKEAASLRGIPDIIGCYRGRFFALEIKRDLWSLYYKRTGKIKIQGRQVLQNLTLTNIRKSGGFGCFIYPQNMDEVINHLLEGIHYVNPETLEE